MYPLLLRHLLAHPADDFEVPLAPGRDDDRILVNSSHCRRLAVYSYTLERHLGGQAEFEMRWE